MTAHKTDLLSLNLEVDVPLDHSVCSLSTTLLSEFNYLPMCEIIEVDYETPLYVQTFDVEHHTPSPYTPTVFISLYNKTWHGTKSVKNQNNIKLPNVKRP